MQTVAPCTLVETNAPNASNFRPYIMQAISLDVIFFPVLYVLFMYCCINSLYNNFLHISAISYVAAFLVLFPFLLTDFGDCFLFYNTTRGLYFATLSVL